MMLFFASGNAMMGDKVERKSQTAIPFTLRAQGASRIREVVIFRNNEIVFKNESNANSVQSQWLDTSPLATGSLWYYVRIQCADGSMAWSSPIWFFSEMPPRQAFRESAYTAHPNIEHVYGHGEVPQKEN